MHNQKCEKEIPIQEFSMEIDAGGRIQRMDREGLSLLDYTQNDIENGLYVVQLIKEVDRQRAHETMLRILNGERMGLNQFTLESKAGHTYSVLIHCYPQNKEAGLCGTVFLSPSRSNLPDLIREHQQFFQTMLDAIPCGLFMVNADRCISYWNATAEKMTGMNHWEVIGKSCQEILNCPNHKKTCSLSLPNVKSTEPLCTDITLNANGRSIHLQKTSKPINASDGKVIGSIESFVDLTPQYQAEVALHEARELVESARKAKRHFMANMNHEIRTPLNGILGFLNLLLAEDLSPSQSDYITSAKRSAHLLREIVDDILDFTIIDKGVLNLEVTGFSLSSVIASVIAQQYDLIQNKRVCIHSQIDTNVPDSILGDSGRLYQILKHLIGNAIKFTPSGEVVVNVAQISTGNSETIEDLRRVMLHFSISDTGVGIPTDKLTEIFESMSQVDESLTRSFGGLGIGLNIVYRLVKLLEGRIWIESEPGIGTKVHFVLPFKRVSSDELDHFFLGFGERRESDSVAEELHPDVRDPAKTPEALTPQLLSKFKHLRTLIDTESMEAEKLLGELKAETHSANQQTLEKLFFRLLLALRREDKRSVDHYYAMIERKIASDEWVCGIPASEGGRNENIDR